MFEQALGDGERQGSLASCSPWGHKGSDRATEQQHPFEIKKSQKSKYRQDITQHNIGHM